MILKLAAANGDDDFQRIARGQLGRAVLALRNNFAITLDGNPLALVTKLLDQRGYGESRGELTGFAIDGDIQHGAILAGNTEACRLLRQCRMAGIGDGKLLAGLDVGVGTQAERVAQRDMVKTVNRLVGMDRNTKRNHLPFDQRQVTFTTAQLAGERYGAQTGLAFALGLDQRLATLVHAFSRNMPVDLGRPRTGFAALPLKIIVVIAASDVGVLDVLFLFFRLICFLN